MTVNELLQEKKISKYRLSRLSGVPYTTINDICTGKTRIEKCSAETIYKIAKVFSVSMEELIKDAVEEKSERAYSFDLYKSSVCHRVKDEGDIPFIIEVLESGEIRRRKLFPGLVPAELGSRPKHSAPTEKCQELRWRNLCPFSDCRPGCKGTDPQAVAGVQRPLSGLPVGKRGCGQPGGCGAVPGW